MPDIFYLISKWWKQMLALVVLSLLVVGIIVFLKPRQYLSVTTAVPASSFSADKSKIFSENVEALYSTLGTPDDLDMILGTAKLDTVFLAVTDQFNLFDHYKVSEKGEAARHKATKLLMRNSKVMKSEYGELKVKVWDTDKALAPQLANAIVDELQNIHQDLQSAGNRASLNGLQSGRQKIQFQIDSINRFLRQADITAEVADAYTARHNVLSGQLQKYEKLISEYQFMVDSKPPVLIVVEKAKSSGWPDRPRRTEILIVTGILSFLFALLAALVMERRKTTRQ